MADEQLFERFGSELSAGTVLCREGEPGEHMWVIQSGKVRISVSVRGVERVLIDLGSGEFFGEMSILNGQPRSATATVLETAKLLVIDAKTFETMIRSSGTIALRMIRKLAARLQSADDQITNLLLKDPTSRVVHAILGLCRTSNAEGDSDIKISMSIAELAARIAFEPSEVKQVLERLQSNRLVDFSAAEILVASPHRLRQLLQFLDMRESFGDI